jgi:hypothetical protein
MQNLRANPTVTLCRNESGILNQIFEEITLFASKQK